MNRDRDALRGFIRENGFATMETELLPAARPSIRLESIPSNETQIPLGASKLGGLPDLPPSLSWPRLARLQNQALPFLAQINLGETHPFDEEKWLPEAGWLYFFGDPFSGTERDLCRVFFYSGDGATLQRQSPPENLIEVELWNDRAAYYPAARLMPVAEVNLPTNDANFTEPPFPPGKTWEDFHRIRELADYRYPPYPPVVNRLLGVTYDIPHDTQMDCVLIAAGHNPYRYVPEIWKPLEPLRKEWQLLLQIDSDRNAGMMWGDAGVVCFHLHQDDFRAQRFENAILNLFSS
jgi:hypothetical protein